MHSLVSIKVCSPTICRFFVWGDWLLPPGMESTCGIASLRVLLDIMMANL